MAPCLHHVVGRQDKALSLQA